jgi:hypothetical protein
MRPVLARALTAFSLAALVLAPAASSAAAAPALPAIHHIWQIQLENEAESASFGQAGSYLNSLTTQGVFLPDYYATGHVSADNYIAQMSGQLANPATNTDCQLYVDFEGTTTSTGIPLGAGCVYPSNVLTLPNQLTTAGLTWNAWMQDMGNTPSRETATCGIPATNGQADSSTPPGTQDDTQTATAADQYAARHNPFVYFHSLTDVPAGATQSPCQQHVLPFSQFQASLAAPANFNWITPNLCNDGHDSPCSGPDITGQNPGPGGLVSANRFLQNVIPQIESSAAYQQDGMIVITFDEGSTTDTSSCCGEVPGSSGVVPVAGPTLGGGVVGALLLSPLLSAHTSTCAYNHFSMLRTYEDLYGIKTYLGNASVANPVDPDLTATSDPCGAAASVPEVPSSAALGAAGLGAAGILVYTRRRRADAGRGPRSGYSY